MLQFTIRRILYMIPTLFVISIISFTIIQLPPGDYLTSVVAAMRATGETIDASALAGPDVQKPALGRGVAFADFDNDMDLDLYLVNAIHAGGEIQMFHLGPAI